METLKVATLIEALAMVGRVYRNKDGSQPADAVKKLLEQLKGAENMTLAEWAESRQPKPKAALKRAEKPKVEPATIDQALARLERAETQAALRQAIGSIVLSAGAWMSLARMLTGRPGGTGKAARDAVETHFSDRLLLNERIEGVKRQFDSSAPSGMHALDGLPQQAARSKAKR
jgi:hypothetical protein